MIRVTRGIKRVRIDVYTTTRGYMCVGSYCRPNRLLRNFYLLLWGLLTDTTQRLVDVYGRTCSGVPCGGNLACGKPIVAVCRESRLLGFNAYNCDTVGDFGCEAVAVEGNCAAWAGAANADGNSILTRFQLHITCDGRRWCTRYAMAHDVIAVTRGRAVKHKICFNSPWTQDAAALIAAVACNCNSMTATSITGQTFNLRGAGELIAGPADIVLVTDAGNLVPAMYRYAHITDTYAYINLTGVLATTEAIRPSRAALCAKVFDTGGGTRLLPLVNLGAIPLEPNKVYSISVHIFGG